jgi:outer membrane receptor for ferrienterochelin and colicin
VPVTDPAAIAAIFGTLPPGGTGAQRDNVGQALAGGVEAKARWLPHQDVTLDLTTLWSETRFKDSPGQPLLEGMPFPQAPEWRLVADLEWRATEQLAFFTGCEYGSLQYDDALASREIPEFTSVRIGATLRHGRAFYQIRVDNLFDEEIQTGLSGDGLRSYAAPRSLWLGAGWSF